MPAPHHSESRKHCSNKMNRKLMKLLYCTILPSLKLTLKVVDDHKSQRVAGNRSLTGVIDVLELCPVFHKHHQWPHPRVHCRHTYTIVPFCVYRKRLMGYTHAHTHTRLTALFSGTTQVGRYQKGKPNLDFTEARDSEWQWHQLGHMQVCTRQITTPAPHHSVFTGRMPFLSPSQQRHSTEGNASSVSSRQVVCVVVAASSRSWRRVRR